VTPIRPIQAGGAQAFLADLARGLAARGHEVQLYCAEGSQVPGVELVMVAVPEEAAEAALVRPGGAPPPAVAALSDAFVVLFAELRRRGADAVSQHAFDVEAIELAAGLNAVHTLHLPPIVPAVVAAVQASLDPVVTVSVAARRAWAAVGVGAGLIPDGVPDFDPGAPAVERLALIAGRVSPEKGIPDGLQAAELAGLRVRVVGSVYDRAYRERELPGLLIEPALPRPELWALMASCAVTLAPVKWEEPFGLVAAEAQVAGCPVVGYRRGALPEVVEDGVSGFLVEPDDVQALAQAIRRALELDRREVRASGRRRLLMGRVLDDYELWLRLSRS